MYERTAMDDEIDMLVNALGDATPNRGTYHKVIKHVGFEAALEKAQQLGADYTARIKPAVFTSWVKRQPQTTQPEPSPVRITRRSTV